MLFSDCKYVKMEIFAPAESVSAILSALIDAGAGEFGEYDHVYTTSKVEGHWRPLAGADPTIGTIGKDETAEEIKIEVNCRRENALKIKNAIQGVHPYEAPVINLIPLCNDSMGTT